MREAGSAGGWRLGRPGFAAIALLGLPAFAMAETEWRTLAPAGEGFSIDFPSEPAVRDVAEMKSAAIEFFHDYRAVTDAGAYIIDVVRFTPAVRAARTDAELLDIAVDAVAGSCEASVPREVPAAGGVSHEVIFHCPDALTMRTRFRFAAEWLYQVSAAGEPGFFDEADAVRFFDSFRLN